MNKRIVAGMLFTTVVCMTLGGCGFTADKENVKNSGAVESVIPGAEVSTEMTERDAEADNGVVQLKVWSEEDNFDMLNQMIDSFEQKYAGQQSLRLHWNKMLILIQRIFFWEIFITGRMFSRLRMISFLQWLPLVHYIRCQMQKK